MRASLPSQKELTERKLVKCLKKLQQDKQRCGQQRVIDSLQLLNAKTWSAINNQGSVTRVCAAAADILLNLSCHYLQPPGSFAVPVVHHPASNSIT
jgi:hypothetical protein